MDSRNGFTRQAAEWRKPVSFTVNGRPVSAPEGEPLVSALAVLGYLHLTTSPRAREPRGAFCLMGVCQQCLIHDDGTSRLACMTAVRAGMAVEIGDGA